MEIRKSIQTCVQGRLRRPAHLQNQGSERRGFPAQISESPSKSVVQTQLPSCSVVRIVGRSHGPVGVRGERTEKDPGLKSGVER